MGGKALKIVGVESERKSTNDFLRIAAEIQPIVEEQLGIETHVVKCFHEKETHGDLDLLLKINHTFYNKGINLKKWIDETFKPKGIFSNGSVISFEYDNFQVDFIPVKESNWEVSKCFFDYDPTGNLMGKIAHKFGLKYGFEGLRYVYRTEGKKYGEITISKDNAKIFDFLGYDYNEYLKGFNTKKEIFDYIIKGKYFDSSLFLMENLNAIDRKRNRKRATYQEFLQFINENKFESKYKFKKRKDLYYHDIDSFFPESNFSVTLKEFRRKEKERKLIASKFNGRLIMEWTNLVEGKDVGNAIREFRNYIGNNINEYLLKTSADQIKDDFLKLYRNEYK